MASDLAGDPSPFAQPDIIKQAVDYCTHQANKGIDSLVALMQRTAADWQRTLDGVSDVQAEFSPAPSEWTTKEVVTHFLNVTDGVNHQIEQLAHGKDIGVLTAQLPEERPSVTTSVAELSETTARVFDDIVRLTRSLEGNPNLGKQFPHPAFGQLDILQWIAFQRLHGMDHMRQIDKNKADAGYPKA
jgi:hypothetical protein